MLSIGSSHKKLMHLSSQKWSITTYRHYSFFFTSTQVFQQQQQSYNTIYQLMHGVLQGETYRRPQGELCSQKSEEQNQTDKTRMNMRDKMAHIDMMGPNYFIFKGKGSTFIKKINTLAESDCDLIIDANIKVLGTQVSSGHLSLSIFCTILWGCFLIIPFFFMYMDWWKKCTFLGYSISADVYTCLAELIRSPSLRNINIKIQDNNFDGEKANIICDAVAGSQIRVFTFRNQAGTFDYENTEYSDFEKNMHPIKTLPNVNSDIRWGKKIVPL